MARQAASREQSPSDLDVKRLLITGYPPIVHELAATFLPRPNWKIRVLPIRPTARRFAWPFGVVRAMPRVDLWYQLSGYAMRGLSFFLSRFCSTIDLPTIIHWTGTDVVVARRLVQWHRWLHRLLARAHHWACAPWLAGELADLGFKCEFMPLPKTHLAKVLDAQLPALPEQFRILSYMNDLTHQRYGSEHLIRLARDLPQVTLAIAGAKGTFLRDCPSNLHFLGWIDDMSEEYAKATVVVRMVEHDGYGGMVQEALAHGRQAIWTYPMPGVHQVKGYEDLKRRVLTLLAQHQRGALSMNYEGREFLKQNMHRRLVDRRIVERIQQILD